MKRAARASGLATLLAVASLAVPAIAAAGPIQLPLRLPNGVPSKLLAPVRGRAVPGGSHDPFRAGFRLKASGGYRLVVIGLGPDVAVAVVHGHAKAETVYVARGTVTPNRLQASFGKLGRVAMRFHPSRNRAPAKPHRSCHGGGRFVVRRGVYLGEFRFTGENGYFSVRSHRATGSVSRLAQSCRPQHVAHSAKHQTSSSALDPSIFEPSFLEASWRHAVTSAMFLTLSFDKVHTLFMASSEQTDGSVATLRLALAGVKSAKAFSLDNALTQARVAPPAPFHGSGTYRAAPDGTTTWSGTLSVNFPGTPRFPLANPPFAAEVGAGL